MPRGEWESPRDPRIPGFIEICDAESDYKTVLIAVRAIVTVKPVSNVRSAPGAEACITLNVTTTDYDGDYANNDPLSYLTGEPYDTVLDLIREALGLPEKEHTADCHLLSLGHIPGVKGGPGCDGCTCR